MSLKSDDPQKRMDAVKSITEQPELLEVALEKSYKNDIRLYALDRIESQHGIWRVWCENGDNRDIADKAFSLIKEDPFLMRIALLSSYEESQDEKKARLAKERRSEMLLGGAKVALNVAGALVGGSAGYSSGSAAAVKVGATTANAGLSMAFTPQSSVAPEMSCRTNEAVQALARIKSLEAVSNVVVYSTVPCVQTAALRRFIPETQSVAILEDVAKNGNVSGSRVCGFGRGGLREEPSSEDKKNILLAFNHIGDPVAITNVIANAGDYSKQVGFARLIQLKAYDQIVAVMCGHEMTEFIRAEPGKRDISQKDAEKIVSRLPAEQKYYEELALKAKSNNIRAVAVSKVENQKTLTEIVLNNDSEIRALALSRLTDPNALVKVVKTVYDFETFKTAFNKIDNIRLLEDFILSESGLYISHKFNYALANIKDGAFLIELLNKAKDLKARKAIAEAIPQADITVDLYEKEKDKEIRRILKNRASEEVQQELARIRLEKIKKAIVIAERDGKELLDLIATKKGDQINGKKIAGFFSGRFLIIKDSKMWNNGIVKHINGERREGCVIIAEKPTGDEWKRNTSMFMDVIFASGASSVKEKFTIGNNVIAMGVVDGNSHIAFEMFGCVVAKDNGLSDKEILHIFDVFDPDDEALDLTVSGADKSPTARYAESVGWELPKTEK
ncbi:MAG: hypothetical protein J6V45_02420 [Kiritimatiellae bacterium]|nr:hypothetical protein [Kiritimatiellia bacterium]